MRPAEPSKPKPDLDVSTSPQQGTVSANAMDLLPGAANVSGILSLAFFDLGCRAFAGHFINGPIRRDPPCCQVMMLLHRH